MINSNLCVLAVHWGEIFALGYLALLFYGLFLQDLGAIQGEKRSPVGSFLAAKIQKWKSQCKDVLKPPVIFILFLVGVFIWIVCNPPRYLRGSETFRFTAVDGRKVDLAQMRGKVVLIYFYSLSQNFFERDKAAHYRIGAMYEKLHPNGFEIIGISIAFNDKSRERANLHHVSWPQHFERYDDGTWTNPLLIKQFNVVDFNTGILLDQKGRIAYRTDQNLDKEYGQYIDTTTLEEEVRILMK